MTKPTAQTLRDKLVAEDGGSVETPSRKLIRENTQANTKVLTDEVGREIVYKTLGPLEQMRLYKVLGDLSSNEAYTRYAMIAMSVQKIDGDLGPPPTTMLNVEARVAWIGEEGFTAIWAELMRSARGLINERTPEEIAIEHRAAIKKSSSDQD